MKLLALTIDERAIILAALDDPTPAESDAFIAALLTKPEGILTRWRGSSAGS